MISPEQPTIPRQASPENHGVRDGGSRSLMGSGSGGGGAWRGEPQVRQSVRSPGLPAPQRSQCQSAPADDFFSSSASLTVAATAALEAFRAPKSKFVSSFSRGEPQEGQVLWRPRMPFDLQEEHVQVPSMMRRLRAMG